MYLNNFINKFKYKFNSNDIFKKIVFILKKYNLYLMIFSLLFTLMIFLIQLILNIFSFKTFLNHYSSEINRLVYEDDIKIFANLESKINSVFYERYLTDNSFSFEIYACPNNYQSYSCQYLVPIYFKNNTNIIKLKKNGFIINFNENSILFGKFPVLSLEIKALFDNVNFSILIYKKIFGIMNLNIYYSAILIYLILYILIFMFMYFIGIYQHLSKILSAIIIVKHDIQSLIHFIHDLNFSIEIKSVLLKGFKRINGALIEFNDSCYIDKISLNNILFNIKSFQIDKNIYLNPIEFVGEYKIPPKILNISISNIVANAFSSPANSTLVRIYSKVTEDNYLDIIIANNGNKIPENIQKKLFINSITYGKKRGKGVALFSISKTLKKYNSKISLLKSDENETVFQIRLQNYKEYIIKNRIKAKNINKIILIEDEYTYVNMIIDNLIDFDIQFCLSLEDFMEKVESNFFNDINEYNIISDYYFRGDGDSIITYDSINLYGFIRSNNFKNNIIVYSSAENPKTKCDLFVSKNKDGMNDIIKFLKE